MSRKAPRSVLQPLEMGRTSQKDLSTLVTIYEAGESLEIKMDQGVSRPEPSGDQSRDVDESGLKWADKSSETAMLSPKYVFASF